MINKYRICSQSEYEAGIVGDFLLFLGKAGVKNIVHVSAHRDYWNEWVVHVELRDHA